MKKIILIISLAFLAWNMVANSQTIRVYNGEKFLELNSGEKLLLYRITVSPSIKGSKPIYNYYFSKDSLSPILPLSFNDLSKAFANNPAFNELLDLYFRNKEDLLRYDTYNKEYKLSRIIELSEAINKQIVLTK